ncbi:hypothetical protein QE152_g20779 [Popillia japonica]|uniref:Uncharacterized protein n=1 Tax=Popillia japonica TaxID=7064 RepID=A0AAW1KNX2_POPJA
MEAAYQWSPLPFLFHPCSFTFRYFIPIIIDDDVEGGAVGGGRDFLVHIIIDDDVEGGAVGGGRDFLVH